MVPKMDPTIIFTLKTTILGHCSTLRVVGNIFVQIWPQNSYFGGFYGYFLGLYVPNNPKMDTTIVFSLENCYTGPIQPTLGIWDHQNVFQSVLRTWAPKKTPGRAKMGLPQFCRISNHFLVLKQHRNAYLALTGPRLCEAFVFLSKNYPKNGLLGS